MGVSEVGLKSRCGGQLTSGPEFGPDGDTVIGTLPVVGLGRKHGKGKAVGPAMVPVGILMGRTVEHSFPTSGLWVWGVARAPVCHIGTFLCVLCEKLGKHCPRKLRESPGLCVSEAVENRQGSQVSCRGLGLWDCAAPGAAGTAAAFPRCVVIVPERILILQDLCL